MNKLTRVSYSLLELSVIVMLIFRSSMVALAAPPQTVPVTVSIWRLIETDNPMNLDRYLLRVCLRSA